MSGCMVSGDMETNWEGVASREGPVHCWQRTCCLLPQWHAIFEEFSLQSGYGNEWGCETLPVIGELPTHPLRAGS